MLFYNSEYFDPDGAHILLQNKVISDILHYFCRRGGENLEIIKRDWFKLRYDSKSEHEFVAKVRHECTKNHKEIDQSINSAIMLENKEDHQCPVKLQNVSITLQSQE